MGAFRGAEKFMGGLQPSNLTPHFTSMSMAMFTQSQNPSNFDFWLIRSYTDYDIKLNGFIRILVWTFD